jgi:hypothetical protein
MLMFVLYDQPHRARPDLRRKLVARLLAHGSTFSRVGASGKPGAVQCSSSMSDPQQLTACMQSNQSKVSSRCRAAMGGGKKKKAG